VQLGGDFAQMDRDFVLDLKPKINRPDRAWLERDGRGTWLGADIQIPESGVRAERKVAILLDISGSMGGRSLEAARRTIRAGIASLGAQDGFGLYAFNNTVFTMNGSPHDLSDTSLALARSWVDDLQASGGTELLPALEHVYSSGVWSDVLVITDGDIGNDHEVAAAASRRFAAGTRTSLLGIGDAPAMDAISAIARAGGGSCATVHPGERLEARALSLFSEMLAARVDNPALRVVNAQALTAEPAAAIHVSTGSRLRCLARLDPDCTAEHLEFSGKAGQQKIFVTVPVVPVGERAGGCGGLAALWARARVADILDRSLSVRRPADVKRLQRQAAELSIEAGILSTAASMVVVDTAGQKSEADAVFVEIPVLMPAGYGGASLNSEPMQRSLGLQSTLSEYICSEPIQSTCCYSPSRRFLKGFVYEAGALHDFDDADDTLDADDPRDADDETILYDLLALQLPGGGFGPEDEVFALLDKDSLEDLAESLGLILEGDGNDSTSRKKLLARMVLTLLAKRYASLAVVWEPLVVASKVFVL
jgi:Ca-activated chloride channel homolog